jgi:hypothetical protein
MYVPLLILGAVGALTMVGCKVSRAGYESAPYEVVRSDGKYELRDYPGLTLVETIPLENGKADGGFNRLFGFITGANETKQEISMTTPVFMSNTESNETMAFVMPAALTSDVVPKPTDGSLRVRVVAAGRFAVLRFSGGRNAENETLNLELLKTWMSTQGLSSTSAPVYGYFDPPWTPAFLRRNEVMLRTLVKSPE